MYRLVMGLLKYDYELGEMSLVLDPTSGLKTFLGSDEMGEDEAAVLSGAGLPEMRRGSAMRPG